MQRGRSSNDSDCWKNDRLGECIWLKLQVWVIFVVQKLLFFIELKKRLSEIKYQQAIAFKKCGGESEVSMKAFTHIFKYENAQRNLKILLYPSAHVEQKRTNGK